MNRRREMAIQRVSRIGGIAVAESVPQSAKQKDSAARAFTIEAALGTYMAKNNEAYSMDYKDTYTSGYEGGGQGGNGQLSRQMREYKSALEETKLANAKSGLERARSAQRLKIKEFEEALANDPSAQYQLAKYCKKNGESDFDRLDANRCSGFLLYSYDKKGVHSVLGEHLATGRHKAQGLASTVFAGEF